MIIHKRLLAAILKAPIYFFDTTPVSYKLLQSFTSLIAYFPMNQIGRIVNRFSSDLVSIILVKPVHNNMLSHMWCVLEYTLTLDKN